MDKYDLVKVIKSGIDAKFIDEFGIIKDIYKDIDDIKLYEILFVGAKTNELAKKYGGALFYESELEGI